MATLADPTDYGHAPGDGPLRPGGQPGTIDDDKGDRPDRRSPQSEAQQPALAIVRDLSGGTQRVRAQTTVYLPKAPGEDARNYSARLARSFFFNAFARTVEGLTGLVFRKDPVLGEDVPAVFLDHWENIDMAGTHGDVFVRERLADVLAAGHGAILVDFPPTDGTQTAADEMVSIRPYWVPILKEDIMSWRTTTRGGMTVLRQVVLRERGYEDVGQFGSREVVRYRVIERTATGVVWTLYEITAKRSVVAVADGVYANQTDIPLAELISSGKVSMFESDPPLLDLAYLNIAHYQGASDYWYAIHMTNSPIFVTIGLDDYTDEGVQKGELVLGPNNGIDLPVGGDAKFVSHDGASLAATKAALDDLKSDMGTMGLAMLAPQKRVAETAEAKRLDKSTSDSALSVTARGLQDGIEQAMRFHARYLPGAQAGGSIEINRDFEGLLMDAPVMSAFATLVNAGFPPHPVLEALQAGGRIRPDADLEELEMEWLAGAAAHEAQAAMEAPLLAAEEV